jgi:hypothetical protein
MGANTARVMSVLVSNAIAANTGTTPATIVAEDILLLKSDNTVVGDTAKVTDDHCSQLIVAAGEGAGQSKFSMPIQVRNIRKIKVTPYEATAQHKVVINLATAIATADLLAGGEYSIGVMYQDNHRIFAELPTREHYHYKAGSTVPTRTEIAAALAARINGVNPALANMRVKQIVATANAETLTIEGLPVAEDGNGINTYQFRYFEVLLRAGFIQGTKAGMTVTPGKPGKGIGLKVIDLEQSTLGRQMRFTWPIKETPKRALPNGKYNLVTIEHANVYTGDLQSPMSSPLTTVIAFKVDDVTTPGTDAASTKQASFLTKLTSVAESAGIAVE